MKKYPLFKVHVNVPRAIKQLRHVLRSGFINEGEQVTKLQRAFEATLEAKNVSMLNSCTSALTLAVKLSSDDPEKNDVITTSMTCVATNTPIVTSGHNIVWADIDPRTGTLDPDSVAKKITPWVRAVMVVAWAGNPPDLVALRKICDAAGVPLILDAAHAFGARLNGKQLHEYADFTCYSLQAIKHVTSGDGGVLVCRDNAAHARAKALKWFGLDRDAAKDAQGNWRGQQWDADIVEAGYKFNMNNMAAALGLSQLEFIDKILDGHRRNAAFYDEVFADSKKIAPLHMPDRSESSHWVYTVRLINGDRDDLLKKLNAEGIAAGLVHVPNHNYTCFKDAHVELPGTDAFASTQLSLPCGWWLRKRDARFIAETVNGIVNK